MDALVCNDLQLGMHVFFISATEGGETGTTVSKMNSISS